MSQCTFLKMMQPICAFRNPFTSDIDKESLSKYFIANLGSHMFLSKEKELFIIDFNLSEFECLCCI